MTKDELKQKIDEILCELDALTKSVVDEDVISKYKSNLLELKLNLLEGHYDKIVEELRKIVKQEDKKYNILGNLSLLTLLSSFVAVFINPYVCLVLLYISFYGIRRLNAIGEDRKNDVKVFENEVRNNKKAFQRSCDLINSKSNIVLDDKQDSLIFSEIKNIDLANKFLDIVFSGRKIPDINDDVKIVVIRMLQSDLQTDENNLDNLLMMASEKTVHEMVKMADFGLKRVKGCNLD